MKRARVEVGWKSIPGQRHRAEGRENEDAVVVEASHPPFDAVLVVADGMGGHALPHLAARTAADRAREAVCTAGAEALGALPRLLREALGDADAAVRSLATQTTNGKPPGTTLTVAVVADATFHVAHVGDGSVFLCREGSVRRLVGGEERRLGNRPENYLGAGGELALEESSVPVQPGDRILICTDGLTRYFTGESGLRGIASILGRPAAGVQAIASQLTAHSRSDDYDDDTSVVVAEVNELREMRSRRELPELSERRTGHPWGAMIGAALVGAALLGAGFMIGRAGRPAATVPNGPPEPGAAPLTFASPGDLSGLPKGSLVLVDDLNGQLYFLPTTPAAEGARDRRLKLRAFRWENGQLRPAGLWGLEAGARRLTDPEGRIFPLSRDPATGALLIQRPARLVIETVRRGVPCSLDGHPLGTTPVRETVAAGPHTLRVGLQPPVTRSIDLAPDETLTLSLPR